MSLSSVPDAVSPFPSSCPPFFVLVAPISSPSSRCDSSPRSIGAHQQHHRRRHQIPHTPVIALFQEKFGRRPLPKDASEFSGFLADALEKNGLPPDFLSPGEGGAEAAAAAVCATATAEVSPVCAILGGILGQEVGRGCPGMFCVLVYFFNRERDGGGMIPATAAGVGYRSACVMVDFLTLLVAKPVSRRRERM